MRYPPNTASYRFELVDTRPGDSCEICQEGFLLGQKAARPRYSRRINAKVHLAGCARVLRTLQEATEAADEAMIQQAMIQPETSLDSRLG